DPDDAEAVAKAKEEQEKVRALGGLHVIGTERHESRRIDNQLRGRAGRQGDPGSSQFYISTEDDLMRIFGGDRMKNLMKTLNIPADMPIENKMISNSIENAQKKVEGNNFDMRKHLVEYDDVINKHREAIYRRRREILEISEQEVVERQRTLSDIVLEMVSDEIKFVVNFHCAGEIKDWNLKEVTETVKTIFPLSAEQEKAINIYSEKSGHADLNREALIAEIFAFASEAYEKLKKVFATVGVKVSEMEKSILIRSIDQLWVEHLETIDYLRRGIGLRGYGQHDPLVEYKKEAYQMYHELIGLIQKQVVYSIYKTADFMNQDAMNAALSTIAQEEKKSLIFSGAQKEMSKETNSAKDLITQKVRNDEGEKIGRNDLCPCGSGKKYKKCCGK
ncbi:MAG: SEC-C metal-binding domain-containing protein, partial [Weeksellaceae bacterium]|nr:SEC-C metal-binding domain-containing protein [Weeksellaceae bacterium]